MKLKKSGPVKISATAIGHEKADAQNITARHAWQHLRKNRCFYIADGVGAGKSYISLSLAFGRWRALRERKSGSGVFRLLIISPTNELSASWMGKLSGSDQTTSRLGTIAIRPGNNSYFDLYLKEFRKESIDTVIYRLRGKHDSSYLIRESKSQTDFSPKKTSRNGRIEVLVATPGWLAHGWKSGLGQDGRKAKIVFEDWLQGVDVIIADEVFGARNWGTQYGQLLRPNFYKPGKGFWNGRDDRPWLIGLSATLLSKDITDAWSLFEMAYGWNDKKYDFNNPYLDPFDGLKADLRDFQSSLMNGLSNQEESPPFSSQKYIEAKNKLENKLRSIIARTPPDKSRSYNFWAAGGALVPPACTSDQFPLKAGIHTVIDKCAEDISKDHYASKNLSVFLKTSLEGKKLFDPTNKNTNPASWGKILEIGNKSKSPKHETLKTWLEDYYDKAEKKWLGKTISADFQFKILLYVHHVDTANAFKTRSALLDRYGKGLQNYLRKRMLRTCHELARLNPKVFIGGSLNHPCQAINDELEDQRADIDILKKPQYLTLLLAALVNMHKASGFDSKVDSFLTTVRGQIEPINRENFIRFLSRYPQLMRDILIEFNAEAIVAFDEEQKKIKKKTHRLTVDAFSLTQVIEDKDHSQKIIDQANLLTADIQKVIGRLTSGKRIPSNAQGKAKELVEFLKKSIRESNEWLSHVKSLAKNPRGHLKRLEHKSKFDNKKHRLPHEIAVQTGQDSGSRDFVFQRFLTPGNPFMLVLTNIGTIGVDLHRFCWDVVHFTPTWSPHELEQKTGRIDRPRIGWEGAFEIAKHESINKVRVHFLIWPNTYDERMLSRVHLRAQYSERLLSSKSQNNLEDKTNSENAKNIKHFDPLDLRPKGA